MCIIVGPVKPSNTILCLKGLRQVPSKASTTTTTESKTKDDSQTSPPPPTTSSPPPVSQIQLFYINNLVSSKGKAISGGVMIVPIAYTTDVQIKGEKEEDDEITPFFVDVKGESVANIAQVIEKSVQPPERGSPRRSLSSSSKLSRSSWTKEKSKKLEVVELKHGGYNVSFAPSLKDLEQRIDLTKLKLSQSEWTDIYANTKLRFGDKKEEKKTMGGGNCSSYGFVVAVPRPGSEMIKRSGFSLVYWTQFIEFPTVHEQTTKTATPVWVDMDVTLLGWNIGIPQKHGGAGTSKDYNKVRYLVSDSKQAGISANWKVIESKIKEEKLSTQGILNEKPKNIFTCDLHFISFLSFKGRYLNINLPGIFLPNDKLKSFKENVEKISSVEKAKDILNYQTTLNKSLSNSGQEPVDVSDADNPYYKIYMGIQMVVESYVSSIHQSLSSGI